MSSPRTNRRILHHRVEIDVIAQQIFAASDRDSLRGDVDISHVAGRHAAGKPKALALTDGDRLHRFDRTDFDAVAVDDNARGERHALAEKFVA